MAKTNKATARTFYHSNKNKDRDQFLDHKNDLGPNPYFQEELDEETYQASSGFLNHEDVSLAKDQHLDLFHRDGDSTKLIL